MSYRVIYTPALQLQIAAQVAYMRDHGVPDGAVEAWFEKLFDKVDSLRELPLRYPVDNRFSAARGTEIRRLVFDRYLILYRVDTSVHAVYVLGFFHGHRNRDEDPGG